MQEIKIIINIVSPFIKFIRTQPSDGKILFETSFYDNHPLGGKMLLLSLQMLK